MYGRIEIYRSLLNIEMITAPPIGRITKPHKFVAVGDQNPAYC
jgi:hypothetical protein